MLKTTETTKGTSEMTQKERVQAKADANFEKWNAELLEAERELKAAQERREHARRMAHLARYGTNVR